MGVTKDISETAKNVKEDVKEGWNKATSDAKGYDLKSKAEKEYEDTKQSVKEAGANAADRASAKARELEVKTMVPGKTNMMLFGAIGGALGALSSIMFLKSATMGTRLLTTAACAGAGGWFGSRYSRRDVVNAAKNK